MGNVNPQKHTETWTDLGVDPDATQVSMECEYPDHPYYKQRNLGGGTALVNHAAPTSGAGDLVPMFVGPQPYAARPTQGLTVVCRNGVGIWELWWSHNGVVKYRGVVLYEYGNVRFDVFHNETAVPQTNEDGEQVAVTSADYGQLLSHSHPIGFDAWPQPQRQWQA